MSYADPTVQNPVQIQQGGAILAIGKGGTLGIDNGATVDMSGLPATGQKMSVADGLVAHSGGTQAAGLPLTAAYNRVITVAAAGDSVVLPPSVAGIDIVVINAAAANAMNIFPNAGGTTTETINALSANAAFSLAANKTATFYCVTAGQWHSQVTA